MCEKVICGLSAQNEVVLSRDGGRPVVRLKPRLLFPSWASHFVDPNRGNETHVFLSFAIQDPCLQSSALKGPVRSQYDTDQGTRRASRI